MRSWQPRCDLQSATPEGIAMRLFYVRGIGVLGLVALYQFVPAAAVVVLAGGYTFLLMRARSRHAVDTDHFVGLHLN